MVKVLKDDGADHKPVPSFFRCPISLEVMKFPVSLSTGVTYDRANIQRWLDGGKNTCPVTMQVLYSKDLVPNHSLQRLIQIWSSSSRSPESDPTQEQVHDLIQRLKNNTPDCRFKYLNHSLSKLLFFANGSDENIKFLATNEDLIVTLGQILGDESVVLKNISASQKVMQLYHLIFERYRDKEQMVKIVIESKCLISMELLLKNGSLESRIATAKVLELISADNEVKLLIAEHNEMLIALLRLLEPDSKTDLLEAGLSCLIYLSLAQSGARVKLIRLGAVNLLGKRLLDSDLTSAAVEKMLKILEMMSSCKEGRDCICGDELCVGAIVKKALKVSIKATGRAVTILWCLCCLFREEKAQHAVIKSNGVGKVLLLMQSNCSPAVRQMCRDLLKIFRVNYKCCVSSYETENTHVMPF